MSKSKGIVDFRLTLLTRAILAGGLVWAIVQSSSQLWAQEPSEGGEEVLIHRVGPQSINVTRNGKPIPSGELRVEVIPQNTSPSPVSSVPPISTLSDPERRELEKWRLLSRYPIRVVLQGERAVIEWAGAQKTLPIEPNREFHIQLSPP